MGAVPLGSSDAPGDGDGVASSSNQFRYKGCVLWPYDVAGVVSELPGCRRLVCWLDAEAMISGERAWTVIPS